MTAGSLFLRCQVALCKWRELKPRRIDPTPAFRHDSLNFLATACDTPEVIAPPANRYIQLIEKTDNLLRVLDPLF
jgi:hypothetical protein